MNCLRPLLRVRGHINESLPQYLIERFALCELINELVQIANLLQKRVLDFLHSNATHHAFDKRGIWIELWCLGEECLQVILRSDLTLQPFLAVTRQPTDDLIDFFSRAILGFCLPDVQRIEARELDCEDSLLTHSHSSDGFALDARFCGR